MRRFIVRTTGRSTGDHPRPCHAFPPIDLFDAFPTLPPLGWYEWIDGCGWAWGVCGGGAGGRGVGVGQCGQCGGVVVAAPTLNVGWRIIVWRIVVLRSAGKHV